jgi:hypothetical protein
MGIHKANLGACGDTESGAPMAGAQSIVDVEMRQMGAYLRAQFRGVVLKRKARRSR